MIFLCVWVSNIQKAYADTLLLSHKLRPKLCIRRLRARLTNDYVITMPKHSTFSFWYTCTSCSQTGEFAICFSFSSHCLFACHKVLSFCARKWVSDCFGFFGVHSILRQIHWLMTLTFVFLPDFSSIIRLIIGVFYLRVLVSRIFSFVLAYKFYLLRFCKAIKTKISFHE